MAFRNPFIAAFGLLMLLNLTSSAPPISNATLEVIINNGTSTPNPMTSPKATTKSPLTSTKAASQDDPNIAAATLKHCTLATRHGVPLKIKALLTGGTSLIKYHINIPQPDAIFTGKTSSLMYRPLFWVRSTGRQGTGLLLLKPSYDRLSLNTLELGVETMTVDVEQHPPNCLRQLNDIDIETLFRELVMNDFQNTSSGVIVKLKPTDNVCNVHLTNNSGTAEFKYICCQRNDYDEIHCEYLTTDLWLNVLFTVIILIKVLVVLFSPRLIPEVYYRVKHVAASYIHNLQPDKKIVLNTVTTQQPDRFQNAKVKIKLCKLRLMEKFKRCIARMKLEEPRRFELDKINLRVKYDRLLPEGNAPVGLVSTMYDSIFKCSIRKRAALQDCCNADFLGRSPCGKTCTWYRVLRNFMSVVLLLLLATPWVLRICAYYMWEHDEMHLRKDAANARHLNFYFPGNMTLFLTPLHVLFVFIYVFLSIESFIFGVLGNKVRERLKMVLRKCFRDMREMSKMEVVGWAMKVLFKPCTHFGGLGLCLGAVFWIPALPILSVIVAFYLLPTLNITFRLLAHFAVHLFPRNCCSRVGLFRRCGEFIQSLEIKLEMDSISKQETLERKMLKTYCSRFQQLLIITMSLISMYSVIFLITEFVSFFVEVFVYTMMGVILNSGTIYTYISLLFLLGVYANECFGHVTGKFLAFNKKIHEVVIGLLKEKVEKIIYDNEENFAFRVKTAHSGEINEPVVLKTNSEGYLRWNVKRLCLFLSKNDKPMIPSKFYFTSCHMPYYLAPGELLVNYLMAAMEFAAILIFLIFVLIVVMAFGDTYEVSATNKLLATVTGGLLPFMLKKVVFKSHAIPTIDEENIYFQSCFNDLVETFEEDWPIYDFDVIEKENNPVGDVTSDKDNPDNANTSGQNGQSGIAGDTGPYNQIDLLIDVRDIDPDEFPDIAMSITAIDDQYNIGSTSLLEDTFATDKETELRNIV